MIYKDRHCSISRVGPHDVCVCVCFRKEFVEAYLRYVFTTSVSDQYSAFSSGFLKVCGGEILSLFQPSELMAMVVGNNNYNWEEMEKVSTWFEILYIKWVESL